jgi:LysR family pca operon transcriptional activator
MTGSSISLRHVRVFLEIVSQRSLRRAAGALHITESAVSKSLRELEQELGTKLLIRDRRGVVATPAGEKFLAHASLAAANFARAIHEASGSDTARARVRVGALPAAAGSLLPRAVHAFMESHPEVDVGVYSGSYEDLVARLRRGEVDMIVGRMITRDTTGLSFEPLYEEQILAVVRASHPLAQADKVDLNQLMTHPILLPVSTSSVRVAVDDFLYTADGRRGAVIVESSSNTFARSYVHANDAVWFVPHGVVALDLEMGWLTALPLAGQMLHSTIGITRQSEQTLHGAAALLARALRALSSSCERA